MATKQNTPCGMDPDIILEHSTILSFIPQMKDDIALIRKKLIDGNGEKSLITKHEILSEKFENHTEMHEQSSSNSKWIMGILVTLFLAIVANLITLFTAMDTTVSADKIAKIEQHISQNEIKNRTMLNEITRTIKESNMRK
jgi:hypothetical protein